MGKSPDAPRDSENYSEGRPYAAPAEGSKKDLEGKKLTRADRAREKAREDLRCVKKDVDDVSKYERVYRKDTFPSGQAEVTHIESGIMYVDPSLEYRATGGVEMGTFDAKRERPHSEYLERRELAKQFLQLMTDGRLNSNIRSICDTEMLGVMDILARYDGNPVECKKRLDANNLDKVYGSYGAYNVLLALKRANLVVPPHKRSEKILYDLQISRDRRPQNRFTELAQKKEAPANPLAESVDDPSFSRPQVKKIEIKKGEEKQYEMALNAYFISGSELKDKGVKARRVTGKEKIGGVDLSDAAFILNEKYYVRLDFGNKLVILTSYRAATPSKVADEELEEVFEMVDLKNETSRRTLADNIAKYVLRRFDWR